MVPRCWRQHIAVSSAALFTGCRAIHAINVARNTIIEARGGLGLVSSLPVTSRCNYLSARVLALRTSQSAERALLIVEVTQVHGLPLKLSPIQQ